MMRPMPTRPRAIAAPRRAPCRVLLLAACLWWLGGCSTVVADFRQSSNFAPPRAGEPAPEASDPAAIARVLTQGGVVLYFRHARTDHTQIGRERAARENGTFSLERCETQRNLSEDGRTHFAPVRDAFASMHASGRPQFSAFWASAYCRTQETARMLTREPRVFTTLSVEMKDLQNADKVAKARAFLDEPVPAGQVKVIVAHAGIFWAMTGWTVEEGHAVVFAPGQRQRIAARLAPPEWDAVAREFAKR
jgi:phosphohistidine phosphatase SixA